MDTLALNEQVALKEIGSFQAKLGCGRHGFIVGQGCPRGAFP
ncbi:MAG: hypothetical protein ACHWZW_04840 [Spirulina sp.]